MGSLDQMLLTLPPPAKPEFEFKHAHDFLPPPPPSPHKRPFFKGDQDVLPSLQVTVSEKMSAPHRGLPPPSAMTLPDPGRIPPPLSTSFIGMPEPPRSWQGAEESMRSWLTTKAEEERRKQEEEKTRQESFRLEQRRIEQTMLLEAIRSGIPPQLVPLIFAGIGSASVANLSVEWLQQYNNSLHSSQHQQMSSHSQTASSPQTQRERMSVQGTTYGPPTQATNVGSAPAPQPGTQYHYQSGPMSPLGVSRQPSGPPSSSGPRAPLQNVLPRLSTSEQQIVPPPPSSGGAVQPPPMHSAQQEHSTSPSIYFHHWVPPTSAASSNPPATPSENANSPKRRRPQMTHPPSLPPTSEPRYPSTSFVHVSSPSASTPGHRKRRLSDSSTTNRGSYALGSKKTRSRGNTESSAAASEEDRLNFSHYPMGGASEDRNDGVRHNHIYNSASARAPKRPRQSYDYAEEAPAHSPGHNRSRKSSFGTAG